MIVDTESQESTVLILTPLGQDAPLAARLLAHSGIRSQICTDLNDLCQKLSSPFGAVLIAEEVLSPEGLAALNQTLVRQEPWSDIPIILLMSSGASTDVSVRIWQKFAAAGNVTLLERPVRSVTITSAIHVALRARRRQYQVRRLLQEQRSATELRDEFISIASHELKNRTLGLGRVVAAKVD